MLPLHWVLQCRLTTKKHCTSFLMSSMLSLSSLLLTLRPIFRLRDSHLHILFKALSPLKLRICPDLCFLSLSKEDAVFYFVLKLNFFPAKRDPSATLNCAINISPPITNALAVELHMFFHYWLQPFSWAIKFGFPS